MFFHNLKIENFRGIQSLNLDGVKQVNLLSGRNNCGKTSILEAVFLLTGMSNPVLFANVNQFRDLFTPKDEDFGLLFKNLDFGNKPQISGMLEKQERFLNIDPIFSAVKEITGQASEKRKIPETTPISTISSENEQVEGLNLEFSLNGKERHHAEIRLKENEVILPKAYKETISAKYLNHKTILTGIEHRLETILVRKEMEPVINALKEIEPAISDIRLGAGGVIYADIGLAKLVPLNLMGDGIRRILSILTAICEKRDGILLIDEIENGLHYSTLSVLWKALLKSAFDNHVQIFATTHSYECIEAFSEVFRERYGDNSETEDEIRLFRIEKGEDGSHKAFAYSPETLAAGIEKDFEVR